MRTGKATKNLSHKPQWLSGLAGWHHLPASHGFGGNWSRAKPRSQLPSVAQKDIITGSRDCTIKHWSLQAQQFQMFEHHGCMRIKLRRSRLTGCLQGLDFCNLWQSHGAQSLCIMQRGRAGCAARCAATQTGSLACWRQRQNNAMCTTSRSGVGFCKLTALLTFDLKRRRVIGCASITGYERMR